MNIDNLKKILENCEDKLEILSNIEFIMKKYNLAEKDLINIVKEFLNDEEKIQLLESDDIIFKMDKYNIVRVIKSLSIENLVEFIKNNKKFLDELEIQPYELIVNCETNRQIDFTKKIDETGLSITEKRKILAMLSIETKEEIDKTTLPIEYQTAINIKREDWSRKIIVDIESNLEDYRGLDDLMSVNPEEFNKDEQEKFLKLCDICPNMQVKCKLRRGMEYISTVKEYKDSVEWIEYVLKKLKPQYTDAQKVAIIDNEIGKKISYSPDFDTEVFNKSDCRAMWKIISNGYGVCNGIAKVEKYILDKVGIESEVIGTGRHSFLKIKNIEFIQKNGEKVKGNTILDPTWNLSNHRFGSMPQNFFISYEVARNNDIDENGLDHKIHKNDENLKDAKLNLDEQSLRNLFASVGLADREGKFPVKTLIEESNLIHSIDSENVEENIKSQFELLTRYCEGLGKYKNSTIGPFKFDTCQNSTIEILKGVLLKNKNLKFNKCVVNRVFNKQDNQKRPILYVYIDSEKIGKKFYIPKRDDKNIVRFTEIDQSEFIKNFDCYEMDLEKSKGKRPWEINGEDKTIENLASSSGKILDNQEAR